MTEVRLATLDDYDQFMTLAAQYLVELRELGSEIKPTGKSLSFWSHLFLVCVDGTPMADHGTEGVLVVVGDPAVGFSIASAPPVVLVETDFGRTAYGHGTYVSPPYRRQGLSRLLRDRMREELKSRGFETIVGGVHLGNDGAARSLKNSTFMWYQIVGYEHL